MAEKDRAGGQWGRDLPQEVVLQTMYVSCELGCYLISEVFEYEGVGKD